MYTLPETELMKIQALSETDRSGSYVIEPLSPGYGVTLGNSLRRVLFSSLEGSAISAVRIEDATHEFTTLPGMVEDIVSFILNVKTLRVKLIGDEPVTLKLEAKGPGEVRASQIINHPQVQISDPEHYLGTLEKGGKLSVELLVEHGRGYVPTEQKNHEQMPLGTISIDSIFTPVKKVHYEVENTRVGGMTNFDKLTLDITTDGTLHPREALAQAAQILVEHFSVIQDLELPQAAPVKKASKKKAAAEETPTTEAETPVEKPTKKKKTVTE